ncbi:MAG: hypothetical protein P1U65_17650 [Minwuia sp.]|nr:hypothetical protein [Minwuia sp.]
MTSPTRFPISRHAQMSTMLVALLALLFVLAPTGQVRAVPTLAALLEKGPERSWGARVTQVWPQVRAFYAERDYSPLWLEKDRADSRARAVTARSM